jgi:hypothetical protein
MCKSISGSTLYEIVNNLEERFKTEGRLIHWQKDIFGLPKIEYLTPIL